MDILFLLRKTIELKEKHPVSMWILKKSVSFINWVLIMFVLLSVPLLIYFLIVFVKYLTQNFIDNTYIAVGASICLALVSIFIAESFNKGSFYSKIPVVAVMSMVMCTIVYKVFSGEQVPRNLLFFVYPLFFGILILSSLVFQNIQQMYIIFIQLIESDVIELQEIYYDALQKASMR